MDATWCWWKNKSLLILYIISIITCRLSKIPCKDMTLPNTTHLKHSWIILNWFIWFNPKTTRPFPTYTSYGGGGGGPNRHPHICLNIDHRVVQLICKYRFSNSVSKYVLKSNIGQILLPWQQFTWISVLHNLRILKCIKTYYFFYLERYWTNWMIIFSGPSGTVVKKILWYWSEWKCWRGSVCPPPPGS